MIRSILILENEDVGKSYADTLYDKLSNIQDIEVQWVRTIDEAINYVNSNYVQIIIFDQRLDNGKLGYDAIEEIKKSNPFIYAIMLSGQADKNEISDAWDKFRINKYISKLQIATLPNVVIEALNEYDYMLLNRVRTSSKTKLKSLRFGIIKMSLISSYVYNDNYIFEDEWKNLSSLPAQGEVEETYSVEVETELRYEENTKVSTHGSFGVELSALKNSIKSSIESNNEYTKATNFSTKTKKVSIKKVKYALPAIPNDPESNYLISRVIEINQVYRIIRCLILAECRWCGSSKITPVDIYIPLRKIAKREIRTYRKTPQEISPLPYESF